MVKNDEMLILTTHLITTARGGYQNFAGAAQRNRLRRFWKTLLSPSLVITCTQVAVGHPHLTGLEEGYIHKFESQI